MQKILERVPLRVKENTACVFVETMKPREDDTPTNTTTTRDDTKEIHRRRPRDGRGETFQVRRDRKVEKTVREPVRLR